MNNLRLSCIDINSPFCPCMLAETNNCVFCSILQGKKVCDCNWQGVCILYEKKWWPQHLSPDSLAREIQFKRTELITSFLILDRITPDTYILQIKLNKDLSDMLNKTGSFVFLRRPSDPLYYHFPVGVMHIEDEKLTVAVEIVGPKSSRLFQNGNNQVIVKGPYYNGILGRPWIDNISCGKILLVAGGMGQAPALFVVSKLVDNRNNVRVLLAPGKIGKIFIREQLEDLGAEVYCVDSMRRTGINLLKAWIDEKPDLIVSCGPDDQHHGIITAMQDKRVNIPMAATNNATMCCGEGICGSCAKHTTQNGVVKTCKVQIDFKNISYD